MPSGCYIRNNKKSFIKKCLVCNKEFLCYPSTDRLKCCSIECANISKRKGVYSNCEICRVVFYKPNYFSNRRFCSNQCKSIWMKQSTLGERNNAYGMGFRQLGRLNPNWKGGLSRSGYNKTFRKIRCIIKKRDDYVCSFCKESFSDIKQFLDVHHKDFNKTNDNPDNLITLCKICHARHYNNPYKWYPEKDDIHISE